MTLFKKCLSWFHFHFRNITSRLAKLKRSGHLYVLRPDTGSEHFFFCRERWRERERARASDSNSLLWRFGEGHVTPIVCASSPLARRRPAEVPAEVVVAALLLTEN